MFALPAAMKSGANLAYKRAGGGTQVPRGGSRPYGYCIDQTVWFFWT